MKVAHIFNEKQHFTELSIIASYVPPFCFSIVAHDKTSVFIYQSFNIKNDVTKVTDAIFESRRSQGRYGYMVLPRYIRIIHFIITKTSPHQPCAVTVYADMVHFGVLSIDVSVNNIKTK